MQNIYNIYKKNIQISLKDQVDLNASLNFSSPYIGQMAVEFLHEINVPFFKVASADTNNMPYLEKTAKKGKEKFSI